MINIKPIERVRGCNTCSNDATYEIKFKDIYNGGTVIVLCDECITELKGELNTNDHVIDENGHDEIQKAIDNYKP